MTVRLRERPARWSRPVVEISTSADVIVTDRSGCRRVSAALDPAQFVERCAVADPLLVARFHDLFTEMRAELERTGAL